MAKHPRISNEALKIRDKADTSLESSLAASEVLEAIEEAASDANQECRSRFTWADLVELRDGLSACMPSDAMKEISRLINIGAIPMGWNVCYTDAIGIYFEWKYEVDPSTAARRNNYLLGQILDRLNEINLPEDS